MRADVGEGAGDSRPAKGARRGAFSRLRPLESRETGAISPPIFTDLRSDVGDFAPANA